jgi:DNA excision repair protein ERCC-4
VLARGALLRAVPVRGAGGDGVAPLRGGGRALSTPPLRIVVDTREQLEWRFSDRCETASGTLLAGDYSVSGFERRWAVERKSLGDYLGSITTGRERFLRELAILRRYEHACVVVEGSLEDLVEHRYRSMASPASVLGTTWMICARYVPVYLAGSRELAEVAAEGLLSRWWRDHLREVEMRAEERAAAVAADEKAARAAARAEKGAA